MKLYVWRENLSWVAVAHANSVPMARQLLAYEMGPDDGPSAMMDRARKVIATTTPSVFVGNTAEFVITDSAALKDADEESLRLKRRVNELESLLAQRASG